MNTISGKLPLIFISACLLAGCGGGSGGSTETPIEHISLGITDARVDGATAVVVNFTAVELKPEEGDAFTIELSPAASVDLLALAGGSSRPLFEDRTVPAGRYQWMRLLIEASRTSRAPTSTWPAVSAFRCSFRVAARAGSS